MEEKLYLKTLKIKIILYFYNFMMFISILEVKLLLILWRGEL